MKKASLLILLSMILLTVFTSCTILFKDQLPTPQEQGHVHKFSEEWAADKLTHFHKCVCGAVSDTAEHLDEDADGLCDACQSQMPPPDVTYTVVLKATVENGRPVFGSSIAVKHGESATVDIMVGVEYSLDFGELVTVISETVDGGFKIYKVKIENVTSDMTILATAELCDHDWQDPTCTDPYICKSCGLVDGEPLGHDWIDADCLLAKTCRACGVTEGDPLGHTPGDEETCTESRECTVCHAELVPALGHKYQPLVTSPTCTEYGYTTYTCSVCSDSYVDDEHVPALGHRAEADDGDCTTAIHCGVCGIETTAAKSHVFDNTCDTTCNNAGCDHVRIITHTPEADDGDCTTAIHCGVCGTVTTEAKPTHTPEVDDGDCTTAIHCGVCGTETTAAKPSHTPKADDGDCTTAITCKDCDVVITAAKSHVFDNTCDTTCNNTGCDHVRTITHTPKSDDGDCTTAIHCDVCGTVTTEAKSHTFDNTCDTTCNNTGCDHVRTITHTPEADDGDCTTAIHCGVCGTVTTEAKPSHTPKADDGDCTTAIHCGVCGTVTTEAKPSHTPEADDGDCTTAIHCGVCGTVTTEAKPSHTPETDDRDCSTATKCTVCGTVTTAAKSHVFDNACDTDCNNTGCDYVRTITHTPEADDGDCTTAIHCGVCGAVTTEAKPSHTPETDDRDCSTATKCTVCGTVTTAAKSHVFDNACDTTCNNAGCDYVRTITHAPEADDGDCTTAIHCGVCGTVTTAAKSHVFDNACDTTCNNAGCDYVRTITHTPEADDGDCTTAIHCGVCGAVTTEAKPSHTPEADDGDCTTAIHCGVCGTVTTEAKPSHTPEADDGDCTTAIHCGVCGTVTTEAKLSHTPEADDGDCTTAITCKDCDVVTTAAKSHVFDNTCDTTCNNTGCDHVRTITHTPEADDGDCTTAIHCGVCGTVTTEAKPSHTPEADDGDCTTAIHCGVCGTITTEAKSSHTPETDDRDCSTATKCTVCGTVTTAAKSHEFDNACDTTCNNVGCDHVRTITHTPEADDGDCTTAIHCGVCGTETTASKSHAFDNACDTTCNNAGCDHVRTITHVPEADDGDCTTAIHCGVCGTETTAAKSHAFDNTCDTTCNNAGCDHTRTITHTPVVDAAVAPTCVATGLTEGSHCSVCSHVITAQTTVSALGHHIARSYDNFVVDHSCTREGCGYSYSLDTMAESGVLYYNGMGTSNIVNGSIDKCEFTVAGGVYSVLSSAEKNGKSDLWIPGKSYVDTFSGFTCANNSVGVFSFKIQSSNEGDLNFAIAEAREGEAWKVNGNKWNTNSINIFSIKKIASGQKTVDVYGGFEMDTKFTTVNIVDGWSEWIDVTIFIEMSSNGGNFITLTYYVNGEYCGAWTRDLDNPGGQNTIASHIVRSIYITGSSTNAGKGYRLTDMVFGYVENGHLSLDGEAHSFTDATCTSGGSCTTCGWVGTALARHSYLTSESNGVLSYACEMCNSSYKVDTYYFLDGTNYDDLLYNFNIPDNNKKGYTTSTKGYPEITEDGYYALIRAAQASGEEYDSSNVGQCQMWVPTSTTHTAWEDFSCANNAIGYLSLKMNMYSDHGNGLSISAVDGSKRDNGFAWGSHDMKLIAFTQPSNGVVTIKDLNGAAIATVQVGADNFTGWLDISMEIVLKSDNSVTVHYCLNGKKIASATKTMSIVTDRISSIYLSASSIKTGTGVLLDDIAFGYTTNGHSTFDGNTHNVTYPDCQNIGQCSCGWQGALGDHNYVDASCAAPATCEVCGDTIGEKLVHEHMTWEVVDSTTVKYTCPDCQSYYLLDQSYHLNGEGDPASTVATGVDFGNMYTLDESGTYNGATTGAVINSNGEYEFIHDDNTTLGKASIFTPTDPSRGLPVNNSLEGFTAEGNNVGFFSISVNLYMTGGLNMQLVDSDLRKGANLPANGSFWNDGAIKNPFLQFSSPDANGNVTVKGWSGTGYQTYKTVTVGSDKFSGWINVTVGIELNDDNNTVTLHYYFDGQYVGSGTREINIYTRKIDGVYINGTSDVAGSGFKIDDIAFGCATEGMKKYGE